MVEKAILSRPSQPQPPLLQPQGKFPYNREGKLCPGKIGGGGEGGGGRQPPGVERRGEIKPVVAVGVGVALGKIQGKTV